MNLKNMKAFEIQQFGVDELALVEREKPKLESNQVLVKFYAASLNYRDLLMVKGLYNPRLKTPLVPFSDGAGEVVEIGESVTRFKVGDRVCPIFMQGWIDGEVEFKKARTALGGDLDGCLREFGAFDEKGLVHIPQPESPQNWPDRSNWRSILQKVQNHRFPSTGNIY